MSRLNSFLSGVRVVDVSRHLPGPFATRFLADLGADVLKLEPPGGDGIRTLAPGRRDQVYFEAVNAGKMIRRLDLRHPGGIEELRTLAATCDVLVESFRPETLARLGAGYETLKERNPALIYCSLNGYGAGSAPHPAGHDLNYLALSGALFQRGSPRTR